MPSEERVKAALEAVAGVLEKHRSAVITTAEEVRGFLSAHRSQEETGDNGVAAGLGAFATGRIDSSRFASLTDSEASDPETLSKVEAAFDILRQVSTGDDEAFYIELPKGGRLRDAIAARLAEIGRAFAAARVASLATVGALSNGKGADLEPLAFDAWNSGERRLAPPLVVELDGADLRAGDLAEFLDGDMKIVLLVNGQAPPAPLVRLITPSIFVLQTSDEAELKKCADAEGPAVAALMPAGAARFVHDPSRGKSLAQRLEVQELPDKPVRKKLGGISAFEQNEELEQLRALAAAGPAADEAAAAGAPGEQMTSVDKLAAFLLQQTDLSDVE